MFEYLGRAMMSIGEAMMSLFYVPRRRSISDPSSWFHAVPNCAECDDGVCWEPVDGSRAEINRSYEAIKQAYPEYFGARLCLPTTKLPAPSTVYYLRFSDDGDPVAVILHIDDYRALVDAGIMVETGARTETIG